MKSSQFIIIGVFSFAIIFISSFIPMADDSGSVEEINIPDNVKLILDNKCFGCHNTESKSDKAKDKLLLDKLVNLPKANLISSLSDIEEVIEEAKMPPERFLEKFPDKALTPEEGELIKVWAVESADKLLN